MIGFSSNFDEVIELWQEAFGDSRDEIVFFLDNAVNLQCLVYYDKSIPVSMMFLIDCKANDLQAKYIYAACTKSEYRKQGLMSKLLSWCKDNLNVPVCLIPANAHLVDYYISNGLNIKFNIQDIKFNQIKDIEEYLFEGCELDNPIALMFKGDK